MDERDLCRALKSVYVRGEPDIHIRHRPGSYTRLSHETIIQNALKTHSEPPMGFEEARRYIYSDVPKKRAEALISYAMEAGKIAERAVADAVDERLAPIASEACEVGDHLCTGKIKHASMAAKEAESFYEELPYEEAGKCEIHPERMLVHTLCDIMRYVRDYPDIKELQHMAEYYAEKNVPQNLLEGLRCEAQEKRKEYLKGLFGIRGIELAYGKHIVVSPKGHVNLYGDTEKEADRFASFIICPHETQYVKKELEDFIANPSKKERFRGMEKELGRQVSEKTHVFVD